MEKSILVTGGAGFIGSHLVDRLVLAGHHVRVFDNLDYQVHGDLREQHRWPQYSNDKAEYCLGDLRDIDRLSAALEGIEVVYHLAAATGVGQSMYQVAHYAEVNIQGTANLLDILARRQMKLEKLILSSSRAVYGEGVYQCPRCGVVMPPVRPALALEAKQWECVCQNCGSELIPLPTPEDKLLNPGSVYAVSKAAQEQLCQCIGQAYDFPVIVLRFFNVYGLRQSLTNPYTGIINTFIKRLRRSLPPEVYEDGLMTRDFIHVSDVVSACYQSLALDHSIVMNVGTGQQTTMYALAMILTNLLNPLIRPQITGNARVGDIRHCTADIARAWQEINFTPQVLLKDGLAQLVADTSAIPMDDDSAVARDALKQSGLLK